MAYKETRKEGPRGEKKTPKKKLMMKMTKTIKTIPNKKVSAKGGNKETMREGLGGVGRASGKAGMLPPNMASRDSIPLGTSPKTGTEWE